MKSYSVCVIGGGPSGYAAAMRVVDFDQSVILVEKEKLGGAGLYNGALSSKTLWELSNHYDATRRSFQKQGLPAGPVNFSSMAAEVRAAVAERAAQLKDHIELVRSHYGGKLEFVRGTGRLANRHEVEIETETGTFSIHAEQIILATGSRPRILEEIPVDGEIVMTSDGISMLEELPESIVILGAGVIGCEFATIFSNFGRTRVFLIDKEPHILPSEDEDLSGIIEKNLEEHGVVIHHGAQLKGMAVKDGRVEYVLGYEDGREEVFQVEKALISVGRVPNMENLGFEQVGLKMSGRGHILDDDTQCNIPNIYAVGDLTADIALVNVGELEGRHAVEKIFGRPRRKLIYENISTIMFLSPETAAVGLNERQAQAKGIPYRAAIFDYQCLPRAMAMRRTQGFFKILVTDDEEMKILGMRSLGEHSSSAIQAVALLIAMDKGIEELAELIHPHPSIIEGIQECARMLYGKSIFKPSVFGEFLRINRFDGSRMVEEAM